MTESEGRRRFEEFVRAFQDLERRLAENNEILDNLGRLIAEDLIPALAQCTDQIMRLRAEMQETRQKTGIIRSIAEMLDNP